MIEKQSPLHLNNLAVTAADMTLLLGAESWLTRHLKTRVYSWESDGERQRYPHDPTGKECLRDFIDLIVNSETMYFTLPRENQSHTPLLLSELSQYLRGLPKAAITLTPELEVNVFNGFIDLAIHRGVDWIWKWTKFQLENPLVHLGHSGRIAEIVTHEGYEVWKYNYDKILRSNLLKINIDAEPPRYIIEYLEHEKGKFSSYQEFFTCYAYDVYRRGWQYLRAVSENDMRAIYFPHRIRNDALEMGTNQWEVLHKCQNFLWSWGEYIVQLIEEPAYRGKLTPIHVAEYIHRIREQLRSDKYDTSYAPKWFDIAVINEENEFEFLDDIRNLQDCIEQTAFEAGLPILESLHAKKQISNVDDAIFLGLKLTSPGIKNLNSEISVDVMDARRQGYVRGGKKGLFIHRGLITNTSKISNHIGFEVYSSNVVPDTQILDKLEAIHRSVMQNQPKYSFPNANKVQIFEEVGTYIENNNSVDPDIKNALGDLGQMFSDLQAKYPQATESEAIKIIDVKFEEIRLAEPRRWQNILSLKRVWNGLKKGSIKVGEHFAEETPLGKAFIGFLEGITDDVV